MMNEYERLIELIRQGYSKGKAKEEWELVENTMADYLLENGVVVLLRDGNDFNPDLYCPYCGNNLSNTKVFEQALKGGAENEL